MSSAPPLAGAARDGVSHRDSPAKPGALSPSDVHVLLVDDERLSRTVVSNLLRRCNYTVTTAENGAEAMELLRSHAPDTFHLVLTDVCMPEVNGLQLLQYVKREENLRSVPVIMMSSIDRGDTVHECVSSGAEEYLVKPVTRKEVQHMWQHVLRKRSALATVPQVEDTGAAAAGGEAAAEEVDRPAKRRATREAGAAPSAPRPAAAAAAADLASTQHFLQLMRGAREAEAAEVRRQLDELDEDIASAAARGGKRARAAADPAAPGEWAAVAPRAAALESLYFERRRRGEPLEGLARDLRVVASASTLAPVATLRAGDTASPQEMVCCADFDADDAHFATVSVSRSVKVFDFGAVLAAPGALHVPVWQAATRSKLSSVSWSAYVRPHLLTSDYDGLVQLWDAGAGPGAEPVASFEEHSRRVWSVDFSKADPQRFVTGSDDGTLRVWSAAQEAAGLRIRAPANVCSVQFSPTNGNLVAAGCANHRVLLYDLRRPAAPAAVIAGPQRAVSYVRFMGAGALAAASTDSAVRVWGVEEALAAGAAAGGPPLAPRCTFSGHLNERNFVGLSATEDGYLATGSEDNSVHAFYRSLPFAVARRGLDDGGAGGGGRAGAPAPAQHRTFASSVCWARGGRHLLAANSQGVLTVLRLE